MTIPSTSRLKLVGLLTGPGDCFATGAIYRRPADRIGRALWRKDRSCAFIPISPQREGQCDAVDARDGMVIAVFITIVYLCLPLSICHSVEHRFEPIRHNRNIRSWMTFYCILSFVFELFFMLLLISISLSSFASIKSHFDGNKTTADITMQFG